MKLAEYAKMANDNASTMLPKMNACALKLIDMVESNNTIITELSASNRSMAGTMRVCLCIALLILMLELMT